MRTAYLATLFLAASLFPLCAGTAQAQQAAKVTMAGYKHNPPVPTPASGLLTVMLQGDTLKVKGEFSGLSNWFRGAYIMVGEKGERGNQLYRLKADLNEERTGGKFEPEENSFVLNQAQKKLLAKGELYLNIASYDHQRGEIRGQIPPLGG